MTDVTGFGLAGHLLEMCRGSGLQAEVFFSKLPFIGASREFAMQGTATGASKRNWESYGAEVRLPDGFADWQRNLLTDPQTSGGLLVACAPEAEGDVLRIFRNGNFQDAKTIGRFAAGPARLSVV
jgi:selenide,water dikinase